MTEFVYLLKLEVLYETYLAAIPITQLPEDRVTFLKVLDLFLEGRK